MIPGLVSNAINMASKIGPKVSSVLKRKGAQSLVAKALNKNKPSQMESNNKYFSQSSQPAVPSTANPAPPTSVMRSYR